MNNSIIENFEWVFQGRKTAATWLYSRIIAFSVGGESTLCIKMYQEASLYTALIEIYNQRTVY
jgi:hypothetical protein